HPEAGAAASKLLLFDRRDTLHSAGDILGPDFMPANRGVWEVDRGQYDHDRWVFGACGGAAAYRRTVWEQLGGFDERLYMYLEDVDLAWRMQRAGWRTLFVPEARVYHHLSATGGGRIASYYVGRNTVLLHRRYLRPHQWARALPGHARVVWQALRAWRGEAARARLLGIWHGLLGKEGRTF
ncbi:MAG: glycosyltransferase, partial [Anaerolineae bacterium]|nr:glycosyltransferase [Caldilineales bacterium]MDW8269106.1 glycosyltransferase [Anaerolineae bacterium]